MSKITYDDKIGIEPKTVAINQWQDIDGNEVKTIVNDNDTCTVLLAYPVLNDKTSAGRRYGTFVAPLSGTILLSNTNIQEGGCAVVIWEGQVNPVISGGVIQSLSGEITEHGVYSIYFHYLDGRYNVNIFNVDGTAPPAGAPAKMTINSAVASNYGLINFNPNTLTESPSDVYENTASAYSKVGVSKYAYAGDFDFQISLSNVVYDTDGCMLGLSTHGLNEKYNEGSNWDFGAYIQFGALNPRTIIDGVTADPTDDSDMGHGASDVFRLVRVSDNLKLYFNNEERQDFGTYAGSIYLHISAHQDNFVIFPTIT